LIIDGSYQAVADGRSTLSEGRGREKVIHLIILTHMTNTRKEGKAKERDTAESVPDLPIIEFTMDNRLMADSEPPDGFPVRVFDHVSSLLNELCVSFISAMKRRGVSIESVVIGWRPSEKHSGFVSKISKVTRLRAVIETEH
jgi:hypothetical protein